MVNEQVNRPLNSKSRHHRISMVCGNGGDNVGELNDCAENRCNEYESVIPHCKICD